METPHPLLQINSNFYRGTFEGILRPTLTLLCYSAKLCCIDYT